jgi:hypothetical protein
MQTILLLIFAMNLSLLFVHEMEAIRHREWKMFMILKDIDDEKAYKIFLLLHIPLYAIVLFLLLSSYQIIGFYVVDTFLVAHAAIHLGFRHHKNNQLRGILSKTIINTMGGFAILHLICILL